MSPMQEASIAIGGVRPFRESVDPVLDMQVRHTGDKAAALPGFTSLSEFDPPLASTVPHTHSLTPLSLPIVMRSSTTDLQAHPVTSLTHASLREVSDNMASTEPARASSSHLLQSDSPRASDFLPIYGDNEIEPHLAVPLGSSFSRASSETPLRSSHTCTPICVTFYAHISDIWTAKHTPITRSSLAEGGSLA